MKFTFMDEQFNISFFKSNYSDMFKRIYIAAYTDEEFWGDVTINIPQFSLENNEVFCSNNSPELITEMINQGYLKYKYSVDINMGTYKVCEITNKLKEELKEENYGKYKWSNN